MNVRMIVGILAAVLLAVSTARGQSTSVAPPAKSSPVSGAPRTPVKMAPAAPHAEADEDRDDDEETPQSRAADKKEQENDLYDEGSEALDDGHYQDAAEKFGGRHGFFAGALHRYKPHRAGPAGDCETIVQD